MENPTFKLEGVVKSKDDLENFEGPLTLILQLLSKDKIEIKNIQISQILDQYLRYLDEMKSMDLEVASEFVAMASHLLYIKTRMLLDSDKEISELEQLIMSLEQLKCRDTYTRIKTVTEQMQAMFRRGGPTYVKPPEYLPADREYRYNHSGEDLIAAIMRVFDRGDAIKPVREKEPFKYPKRIVYSVGEKAEEILETLRRSDIMRIGVLMHLCMSRTELVATFIAILELCKSGQIMLSGDDEDLIVTRTEHLLTTEEEKNHGDT